MESDLYYMQCALAAAKKAYYADEVPVGAVLVYQGQIISQAHNQVEKKKDATQHAELLVLQAACQDLEKKYLPSCVLYVTLEPCAMCAMASYWVHLGRIVFGAADPKQGYRSIQPSLLHPKTSLHHGLLAEESKQLLQAFFQAKRAKAKCTGTVSPKAY